MLNGFDDIENAVVTTRKNSCDQVSKIIAFVKLKNKSNATENYIKERLKNVLPEYMIPSIKIVEKMPLTSNGKIYTEKLLGELNGRANS